jgi:phosphate transport system protein
VHRLSIGIHQLHTKLLEMGELVELSLTRSVRALAERDHKLAEQVLNDERRINRLEIEIDDMTIGLLALHQPVARDLRFITASFKINTDLERIGDLAVTIARRAISLMTAPENTSVAGKLQTMAGLVISMLSRSLSAYLEGDPQVAREVLTADDAVDRLRDSTNADLIDIMHREPAKVAAGVDLLFVSRTLERIADHATNIAEDVVFLVSGEDVRHRGRKVA